MTEERKLRHLIARFSGVRHCNVEIAKIETLDGQRKVVAKVKGYKYCYLFHGDNVIKTWRVML